MNARRRIFREDAWASLEPVQKGLVIGVGLGALLWVFTDSLSWLAVGVGLGVFVGQRINRRRARTRVHHQHLVKDAVKHWPVPRHTPPPKVLTDEDRERSLRASAHFQGLRLVTGRQGRTETLARMRETIGGFLPERYEAELDAALSGIEKEQVKARARRAEFVAEARKMDPLNAVFSIYYFNSRHASHPEHAGLAPIKLAEALGDLFTPEQIEAAQLAFLADEAPEVLPESWLRTTCGADPKKYTARLLAHPDAASFLVAFACYFYYAIPDPAGTEGDFWFLTAPYQRMRNGHRALARLTIQGVETMVLLEDDRGTYIMTNLAPYPVVNPDYYPQMVETYTSNGSMQNTALEADIAASALTYDSIFRTAARRAVVGLMRKGRASQGHHHDWALADAVYAPLHALTQGGLVSAPASGVHNRGTVVR